MSSNSPPASIKIFVASPSDVRNERDRLPEVINELNRTLSVLQNGFNTYLELVKWETHAYPQMGRPQQVINEQIGRYDIFIGILWKRFGIPTGIAESGTQEEFDLAYKSWQETRKPHIMFYFSQAYYRLSTTEEIEQLKKVHQFRDFVKERGLFWEYPGADQFIAIIRAHLIDVIGKLLTSASQSNSENLYKEATPASMEGRTSPPVGANIQLLELGPLDSFFKQQEKFIGRKGLLIEARDRGEWHQGVVKFEIFISSDDDGMVPFFQFKYKVIE